MRRTVTALVTAVALVAAPLLAPVTASAAPAPPGAPADAASGSAALPPADVTLITGDRVHITDHDGRQAITTTAAGRGPAAAPVSFSTFVMRGDTYVLPSDAGVYAGNQLGWSLFDVSALVRGGLTGDAALPLTVDYTKGADPRALPGLVRKSASRPDVVTESRTDAPQFGKALAAQLQFDAARAHGQRRAQAAGTELFSGVRTITLDSPTAAAKDPSTAGNPEPDPGFDMQTLTLKAIGRDGKAPSTAYAGSDGYFLVEDVNDPTGFAAEIPVTPAKENWSVPAGTYDVRAFVYTWFQKTITINGDDGPIGTQTVWDYSMSFIWEPQVAIKSDTSLTFDARTANEVPITATPDSDTTAGWRVPGTTTGDPQWELVTDRVAPDGSDLPWYWASGAHALDGDTVGLSMYVAPSTQKVTLGSRHFYTAERLESPATGHTYDLQYPSADGSVPASFATRVTAKQLAAVPTTYSSEVPGRIGSQARFGYEPWETINTREGNPIAEPLNRTEYVLAGSDTLWQESAAAFSSGDYPAADNMFGPYTRYKKAGAQAPVRWFDGPRHPGVEQPGTVVPPGDVVGGPMVCPACRTAGTLGFDVAPYVDGNTTDWGPALDAGNLRSGTHDADAETLQMYTNGTLTAQDTTADDPGLGSGPTQLPVGSGRAQYQLDYTVARSAPWSSLSTQTSTRWDFTSAAPKAADPLPAGWTCGPLTGSCAFVPLLLLDYTVPLDEHEGVQAPGTVTFTVHAYHQPHAPTTATVDTPTVSLSYDDGASWQPVTTVVPAGKGTFRVTIKTPDPSSISGFVSLRVGDTDSAGSDITQTIIRAFTLSGSAASRGAGVGTAPPPTGGGGGVFTSRAVCAAAPAGDAACDAIVRTTSGGAPAVTPAADVTTATLPSGYGPPDLAAAYHLPKTGGSDQTIAVVDAAGDPNIVADVAAYRAEYGLPACTTGTGCLKVVNQAGDGPPPAGGNPNWGVETALDLDMVSAACPGCHLLLVVANTAGFTDLAAAEQTAAGLGANVISNSYGSYEQVGVQSFAAAYRHPGIAVVASSGDQGFGLNGTLGGTQFPASLPSVTAVGGTRLVPDAGTSRGWDETAWADGGSGCSAYFAKPAYQTDANCHMRTVADVSAVADPDTGVAVYDSALTPGGGWLVVGGTSASAPLIAGMYGLAGNAATVNTPGYLYRHAGQFTDVTSGSNGYCGSTVNYLCNAKKGFDAPTGLGTPNGVGGL